MVETSGINYVVRIYRKDQNNITVFRSDNYDACYKLWQDLQTRWLEASKEPKPFVLTEPLVTAFEPGLITEISLLPVPAETVKNMDNNPYYSKMKKEGFSQTFRSNTSIVGEDILDGGYRLD